MILKKNNMKIKIILIIYKILFEILYLYYYFIKIFKKIIHLLNQYYYFHIIHYNYLSQKIIINNSLNLNYYQIKVNSFNIYLH